MKNKFLKAKREATPGSRKLKKANTEEMIVALVIEQRDFDCSFSEDDRQVSV